MMKLIRWVLKWLNLIFLSQYYQGVLSYYEAPYQDGKGARLVHEILLKCSHKFWCEIDRKRMIALSNDKPSTSFLCDACLLDTWIGIYKDDPKMAMVKYNRWSRVMKGVSRRRG